MDTNGFAEVFPAGDFLAEELETRGWTQSDFAEILGRPAQFVSEIIAGKKEITRESAAQIGAALGTSAQLWLNLQDSYYLWRQNSDSRTQAELTEVRRRARLNEHAPISILVKRGFIRSTNVDDQEREIAELYGVSNIENWEPLALAARRSNLEEDLTATQQAWAMCVRKVALARLPIAKFSEDGLRSVARRLPSDLRQPDSFAELPQRFAEVGVRLVFVESFPGSKLDGCSFIIDGIPAIGLSGRGQRLDKVLFTLLHEVAHVLLGHLESGLLIVDEIDEKNSAGDEAAADQQAASWMLPEPLPKQLPNRISLGWINEAARTRRVHAIIVIGRLQKLGALGWKTTLVKGAPNAIEYLRSWR